MSIDTTSSDDLHRSISEALNSDLSTGLALERALLGHLASENAPQYVFLDNVANDRLTKKLSGLETKSVIVATSRTAVRGVETKHQLQITAMEVDEAVELIHRLRPGSTDKDAHELAITLGRHPLAIEAVCGQIIDMPDISIPDYCRHLRANAGKIFDGTMDDGRPNLTPIYRQMIDDLRHGDPIVCTMLEMLAHGADAPLHDLALPYAIQPATGMTPNLDHADVVSERCLRELERRFLITRNEYSEVVMHTLTRAIIADLAAARRVELNNHLFSGILDAIAEMIPVLKDDVGIAVDRSPECYVRVTATLQDRSWVLDFTTDQLSQDLRDEIEYSRTFMALRAVSDLFLRQQLLPIYLRQHPAKKFGSAAGELNAVLFNTAHLNRPRPSSLVSQLRFRPGMVPGPRPNVAWLTS